MNFNENDSMWLQKSIHVADPIPDMGEMPDAKAESNRNDLPATEAGREAELDLTRMASSANTMRLLQCPSQRLSCRLSVSNTAFASLQEIDDLRARVSQLTRERLKWSSSQRDLDIARFELTQAREELETMQGYVRVLKGELDESNARASREAKGRQALETQLSDMIAQRKSETHFLKQQIDDIKEEHSRRLAEMMGRSEVEGNSRAETLREQILKLSDELEAMEERSVQSDHERARLQAENNEIRAGMKVLRDKYAESQRSLDGNMNRCTELEMLHAQFVEKIEKSHAEAIKSLTSLSEERIQQLTSSKDEILKDLKEELAAQKNKNRSLSDELSSLRHRCQLAEEEVRQCNQDHEKELKRMRDEHRLALCQQQLQTESLVREAKGGRLSMEEENSSLRRQQTKVSEELSTVTAVLSQREKHISHLEKELSAAKEAVLRMEQEHIALSKEVEVTREAINHAEDRVQRLMMQQDSSDADYSRDLHGVKDQLASAQEELVRVKAELSSVTQEGIRHETESRSIISDLRAKLEALACEKDALQQMSRDKKEAEELVEEYRAKYFSMCKKAENLDIELSAVANRCSLLERRLDEELRRSLKTVSLSPTPQQQRCGEKRLRSASSVNVPLSITIQPVKKSRSIEPRVFAISGFEGNELLMQIRQLPYASVAECRSNTPVPSNLTHLVTNGQLTIKLLTALVRGCWILPEAFVRDSVKEQQWQDESVYGFRHEELPLSHKRVAFTEGFLSSRHYSTANLIITEGGAIVENERHAADFILCTHSECCNPGEETDGLPRMMTWDKMVDLIYPVKIGEAH